MMNVKTGNYNRKQWSQDELLELAIFHSAALLVLGSEGPWDDHCPHTFYVHIDNEHGHSEEVWFEDQKSAETFASLVSPTGWVIEHEYYDY